MINFYDLAFQLAKESILNVYSFDELNSGKSLEKEASSLVEFFDYHATQTKHMIYQITGRKPERNTLKTIWIKDKFEKELIFQIREIYKKCWQHKIFCKTDHLENGLKELDRDEINYRQEFNSQRLYSVRNQVVNFYASMPRIEGSFIAYSL